MSDPDRKLQASFGVGGTLFGLGPARSEVLIFKTGIVAGVFDESIMGMKKGRIIEIVAKINELSGTPQ